MRTTKSREGSVLAAYVCLLVCGAGRAAPLDEGGFGGAGSGGPQVAAEVTFRARVGMALSELSRVQRRAVIRRFVARHLVRDSSMLVSAIRADRRRIRKATPEWDAATKLLDAALRRRACFRLLEDRARKRREYRLGMARFAGVVRRRRLKAPPGWG